MKRHKHSLSHYNLLSCDMGELVPCGLVEVLPGDTIQHATSMLVRVSPLLAPMMHPVHIRVHHWFVPHRLVWDQWEDFITGGPTGTDASVFPTRTTNATEGSLADYLGMGNQNTAHNALPFRGYSLIWNEWYRDQDLQTELVVSKASGVDSTTNVTLQKVCWEKDYFTSSRPWAQKGPSVTLPLGVTAPVVPDGTFQLTGPTNVRPLHVTGTATPQNVTFGTAAGSGDGDLTYFSGLEVDLSGATAVDVNTVREAFALQRYAEARARYGSRYTEYLRYLGVRSSDARLQRPEYLGGGRNLLQISEVLQTGVTTDGDDTDGVGNLKGHGIAAMRSNRYRRFFEEHGYVFSLLSVKPKTMYVDSINRMHLRRTKEDFFQKELQHIGQQEITRREVWAGSGSPTTVFGYQDRYDEYRRMESRVAGEFKSTLNYWHMARIFASTPVLNAAFVESNPTKRVNAEQTQDSLWIMANHSIQARRMVARTGSSFTF